MKRKIEVADPIMPRPTYTPEEVAAILRLHPVYCRRLFTLGQIPGAIRLGRAWRLPAAALDRILETGLKTTEADKVVRNSLQ
jgi:excisionase family DNA binding protein